MWSAFLDHNTGPRRILKEWDYNNEYCNLSCVIRKEVHIADDEFQDFLQALLDLSVQASVNHVETRLNIDISRDTGGFIDEILYVYSVTKLGPRVVEIVKTESATESATSTMVSI